MNCSLGCPKARSETRIPVLMNSRKGAPGVHVVDIVVSARSTPTRAFISSLLPVEKFEQGICMPAPRNMSLTAAASKSFFLSMREPSVRQAAASLFSLVSTASRLLPFNQLSRAVSRGPREETAELRHRAVEGDPSYDRALAILVLLALFEQHLEFFHFLTLFF